MTDVGLAQLKELDLNTRHDLDHPDGLDVAGWSLVEEWGEGEGVEEHSKIIGLEDFLRTEHALAEPRTVEEIDSVHLIQGILGDRRDEHETFQYSVKETGREQHNPDHADDNLVTDLGRLKRGISDPDNASRSSKAQRTQRLIMQLDAQNRMLNDMYKQMAELTKELGRLRQELADINSDLAEINEMQEFLEEGGDFNDNTARGRNARRSLETQMRRHGVDSREYTNEDGTIDTERAEEILAEREAELEGRREQVERDIETTEDKITDLEQDIAEAEQDRAVNMEAAVAEGIDTASVADTQSFANVTSFYATTNPSPVVELAAASDSTGFSGFSSDADAPDAEVMAFYADDNMGFGAPETTPVQAAFTPDSTSVSLDVASAFNADPSSDGSNVITAAFTQVSDLELAEARIAEAEAAQLAAQDAAAEAEKVASTPGATTATQAVAV